MAAFDYVAINPTGDKERGVIQADSERHARQLIREQGLYPVTIALGKIKAVKGITLHRSSLNHLELTEFTRQFAVLLEAGIPIDEALLALSSQQSHIRVKRCALGLRSLLMEGHSLSDAMAQQPAVFSRLYRSMVAAGEQSGALSAVLERLADYLESSRALKSSIRMALAYPAILTLVAVGVIFVLMSYVVPKIVDQFNHAGQTLPALTEFLIVVSRFLNDYWMAILAVIALGLVLLGWCLKYESVRYKIDSLFLRLPILRRYLTLIAFARLSRTLAILLSSGINLLDALKVATQVIENRVLRDQLSDIHEQVKQGASIAKAFDTTEAPPMFRCLVENGEKSGELASSFKRAAVMMEGTLEERIKMALTLFEPLLILIMGGCVLAIVLAILLPILELNNMTLM
ncbi:type II secretion system inner membrane protein GspF [Neptuniibacter sp. QD34_54]|uniref:type II secretion system inner membrane protein GspF n=1 Tax=Neptuniibacter sp. QD34_54 TaxID=3398208 RepID=UPI0039F53071